MLRILLAISLAVTVMIPVVAKDTMASSLAAHATPFTDLLKLDCFCLIEPQSLNRMSGCQALRKRFNVQVVQCEDAQGYLHPIDHWQTWVVMTPAHTRCQPCRESESVPGDDNIPRHTTPMVEAPNDE